MNRLNGNHLHPSLPSHAILHSAIDSSLRWRGCWASLLDAGMRKKKLGFYELIVSQCFGVNKSELVTSMGNWSAGDCHWSECEPTRVTTNYIYLSLPLTITCFVNLRHLCNELSAVSHGAWREMRNEHKFKTNLLHSFVSFLPFFMFLPSFYFSFLMRFISRK